ncbi:unnamed protein product [Cunninghamella echinulata]
MSSSFLHMKTEGKLLFAAMLRKGIWRWIETYPNEFRQVCTSENRLLAGSEILFDLCSSSADTLRKKAVFWPLQTVLLMLTPDLLLQAFLDDPTSKNRRSSFLGTLRSSLQSSRTAELAAVCYVDLCKASTFVPSGEESILRHITTDIEDELNEKIWKIAESPANTDTHSNYTVEYQQLFTDFFLVRLQQNSESVIKSLLPAYFKEGTPLIFKQSIIKAALYLVQDKYHVPWRPSAMAIYAPLVPHLFVFFIDAISPDFQVRQINKSSPLLMIDYTNMILNLMQLFKTAPLCPILDNDDQSVLEKFSIFLVGLANLSQHNDAIIRISASESLTFLHSLESMMMWGSPSNLVTNFWYVSSQVIFCLARQILDIKQNDDGTQCTLKLLSSLLEARNAFLQNHLDYVNVGLESKERLKSSVALEIACLISLCSTNPDVCSTARDCLSYLCKEISIVEEDNVNPAVHITLLPNLNTFTDLVSQNDTQFMFGRKAQQKRLRKYLRALEYSTPGVMAAWEEGWIRWKVLTKVIYKFGEHALDDNNNNSNNNNNNNSNNSDQQSSIKKVSPNRHEKLRSPTTKPLVPIGRLEVDEEKQALWQNYTGFLAALGGCCLKSDKNTSHNSSSIGTIHNDSSSTTKGQPQQVHNEPAVMVEIFIGEMIELLTADNVVVREGAKDALGNDLAPSLFAILSRHLESTLSKFFNTDGEPLCGPTKSLFVEQSISILKLILDRLVGEMHFMININFGTLITHFVIYINGLQPSYATTRMKINFCHLLEGMILKKDQIIIGNETWLRNRLLETLMEWTTDFSLQAGNKNSPTSISGKLATQRSEKILQDLDLICIKTIATLSKQLPIQSLSTDHEVDALQSKSRIFFKYITFFTKVLNRCGNDEKSNKSNKKGDEISPNDHSTDPDLIILKENAILAMSNLLSANVDIGLKHTLTLGAYNEDLFIRTAFIQVLTNILYQGTEFDSLAENAMNSRYEKLLNLLVESDLEIALSLCHVCPTVDTADVAKVLIKCFSANNKLIPLMKHVIDKEVRTAESESALFRGTTMTTQLLSGAASQLCAEYVLQTLYPALVAINSLPEEHLTWELNPQRLSTTETISKNRQNIIRVTDILLNAICSSASKAPKDFREQLYMIVESVRTRYPESKYTAVGGFVFLRLFCVAALTPEKHYFPNDSIPRNRNVRKIILQANRIIQNLSNNVLFGSKDTHLVVLNDFLTNNIYKVTTFLREISQKQGISQSVSQSSQLSNKTYAMKRTDSNNSSVYSDDGKSADLQPVLLEQHTYEQLHRYLHDNLDRISRDLSSRRTRLNSIQNGNGTRQQASMQWKSTLDQLVKVLAELGRPSTAISQEEVTSHKHHPTRNNHDYSEFVRRHIKRDVSSIRSLNAIYQRGVSRAGNPVFYIIAHLLTPDVDFELLIFYMLNIMEPFIDKPFDIVFDTTRMNPVNEIPVHWMNTFLQLIFQELNENLVCFHIFNPNSHLQRYIRKIPLKITNRLLKKTHFAIKLSELHDHIAPSEVHLPKSSYELEKEIGTSFSPVSKIVTMNIRIPVVVRVTEEHLQVITVREQEIFFSLNTKLNDIYHISEVDEVYSLPSSKSNGTSELVIKHDNGKTLTAFSSPKRDAIVEQFVQNKKRYEATCHGEINDRAIRPNDVPGRLLNMALLNLGSDDPNLRLSAYNLLFSLNTFFRFDTGNQLLLAKDLCIPENNTAFIVSINNSLAITEAHLTFEFIQECVDGYKKSNHKMRLLCLDYMSPWLKNLARFCRASEHEDGLAKVKDILRLLIEITLDKQETYKHVQARVWGAISEVDELINPVLDILIQYSIEKGVASPEAEALGDTIVTMASVAVRGKIINRLRRAIQRSSTRPFKSLADCPAWTEIAVLLRFLLMLSFNISTPMTPYLPEVFHIVSLLVCTGSPLICTTVHELVVNIIHTLCTNRTLPEENRSKLRYLLNEVCDGDTRHHFGLLKTRANAFTITADSTTISHEMINLSSLESIVRVLLEVLAAGALNTDTSNVWRARWMGLVASTAFQFNPAIQPRSFVVLGCLAQEEVDDDLMYQILVAMRGALAIFNDTDPSLITSIMMCLTNIIASLPRDSQYMQPMFWLAVALVQMGHPAIFSTATKFLQSVLRTLDARKYFAQRSVKEVMMEVRESYSDVALELDKVTGVSFYTNFSFALAGILLKGVKYSEPSDLVFQCLTTFLEIESKRSKEQNVVEAGTLGYFAGLLPFAAQDGALRELLRLAGIDDIDLDALEFGSAYVRLFDTLEIPNNTTALLLVSTLMNILNSSETDMERVFLYSFLSEAAVAVPEVFSLIYESLLPKMNQIMISSQNHAVLDAVKNLLMNACAEKSISNPASRRSQRSYLEELGFSALGDPTFGASNTNYFVNAELASKLLDRITS